MKWKAVMIDSEHKNFIQNIIYKISDTLIKQGSSSDLSLMSGELGKGLFFTYLNKSENNYLNKEQILGVIPVWQKALETTANNYTLSSGIGGYIFYLNYLCENDFVEREIVNDLLNQLLELSLNFSKKAIESDNYDFLHGGLGLSVSISNYKLDDEFLLANYLQSVIKYLNHKQICIANDAVLWSSKLQINDIDVFNLGLAHGNPSVLNVLIDNYKKFNNNEELERLIISGINGLLHLYKKSSENNISSFPNYFDVKTMKSVGNSRLAWCYGDLGIAITFVRAGLVLSNKEWINKGIEIGLKTCKRNNYSSTYVIDSGLCHGDSGVALIYSRLYNYTNEIKFKESAEFWYNHTIKNAFDDSGILAYHAWDGEDDTYKKDYGFLEGIAGIGLSLIASISNREPTWDRCLLLS